MFIFHFILKDSLRIIIDSSKVITNSQKELMNPNIDLYTMISAIAAAVSAIVALFTIINAVKNQRAERNKNRPYFIIEAPGFKPLPNNSLRLQITFINKGRNPASNFRVLIRIFDMNYLNENQIIFDVVNDIPPDSPTPYYNDGIGLPANLPPHFIYCEMNYTDNILNTNYSQRYFMKWDGVQQGTTHPDFVHTNKEEKIKIEEYVNKNKKAP